MPDAVICFKWKPAVGYRSTFGPETVNTLQAMVKRHFPHPHRFICFTDDSHGINRSVDVLPLWNDFADVPSPHGGKNPSCYRRLRMFSPEMERVIGKRFVSIDLDCVVTGDLTPVFDRPEDFAMWGDTNPQPNSHYNGSLVLQTAGARRQVWEKFDPKTSPAKARAAGCWGSDQGWISYCLGPGEKKWTKADGVYSFRNDLRNAPTRDLPKGARVVMFHGEFDPWQERVQTRWPWVRQHWTQEQAVTA